MFCLVTNTYTPFSAKYITQLYKQDINHDNHLDSLQGKIIICNKLCF